METSVLLDETEEKGMFEGMLQNKEMTPSNEMYEEWVNADVINIEVNTENNVENGSDVMYAEAQVTEKETSMEEASINTRAAYPNVEGLLKSEIKEISCEMISEMISHKVLNDVTEVHKQQVSQFEEIRTQVLSETEYLERAFERTMSAMIQSKNHVLKGEKMADILSNTVNKLGKNLKDKMQAIKAMNQSSKQQHDNIKSCHSKIIEFKAKAEGEKKIIDKKKSFLQSNLSSCVDLFTKLKEKVDQLSQLNSGFDEQYEKCILTKQNFEKNIAALEEQRSQKRFEVENKMSTKTVELDELRARREGIIQKINNLSRTKIVKMKESEQLKESIQSLQSKSTALTSQNKEKMSQLIKIKELYENLEKAYPERITEGSKQMGIIDKMLNKTERDLISSSNQVDTIFQNYQNVQWTYMEKFEQKNEIAVSILGKSSEIRDVKLEIEHKGIRNNILKERLHSLVDTYDAVNESVHSEEHKIVAFKEISIQELSAADSEIERLDTDFKKQLESLTKEKELKLVNSHYFKERLEDLEQSVGNVEKEIKEIGDENTAILTLVETKKSGLSTFIDESTSLKEKYTEAHKTAETAKKAKTNQNRSFSERTPNLGRSLTDKTLNGNKLITEKTSSLDKSFTEKCPRKVTFNKTLFVKHATESDDAGSQTFGPNNMIFQELFSKKELESVPHNSQI